MDSELVDTGGRGEFYDISAQGQNGGGWLGPSMEYNSGTELARYNAGGK